MNRRVKNRGAAGSSRPTLVSGKTKALPLSLLTAAALIVLVGLLALALAGCASEETAAESDFAAMIARADEDSEEPTPASFISLCANCHDKLDPGPGDPTQDWRLERKLVFNHPKHFAQGIRCQACHQEFPHKPGETMHVPVETCFTCHGSLHGQQGVMAPTDCDACHTKGIASVTPAHQAATWRLAKGEDLAGHSQEVKKAPNRQLYCKMCHEATFCQDCHGMEIPHPEDWQASHKESGKSERTACLMCHETKNACNECHHQAFPKLADWSMEHKQVAVKQGAGNCFDCHEPPYCSNCHVSTGKNRGVLGG